jgi:NarL family two-component system response regulator LiaR
MSGSADSGLSVRWSSRRPSNVDGVYSPGHGTQVKPPIRLAIVDDYAVVVAGVASFLAEERIDVVETGASMSVITDVDIVLYDTFGQVTGEDLNLEDFVRESGAKVVIYSWNLRPDLIHEAMTGGASGYLSKVLTGPAIVNALERILAGERVILTGDQDSSVDGAGDWPGRSAGLSPREAEIIALIARGLSNQDIAERSHVTMNSIKSYIRSAYRKMGVESRTQAVLWAMSNGFIPDIERTIDPALQRRPAPAARTVRLP